MKMQYHNNQGGNNVSHTLRNSSGGALGCSPKYIYFSAPALASVKKTLAPPPCCAPFPSPGLHRQPQDRLTTVGPAMQFYSAILKFNTRRPAECLLFISSLLFPSSLVSSASYFSYLLVYVSSAALKRTKFPGRVGLHLQTLAKLLLGSDTTALSGFEITPTSINTLLTLHRVRPPPPRIQ